MVLQSQSQLVTHLSSFSLGWELIAKHGSIGRLVDPDKELTFKCSTHCRVCPIYLAAGFLQHCREA